MQLTLSLNLAELEAGQVVLEAELKNNGQESVELLPWNTPMEATLLGDLYRITHDAAVDAQALPYLGRMVKRAAPEVDDYVVLKAGEVLRNTQRLSEGYSFCANRAYRLEYIGVFVSRDNNVVPTRNNILNFTTGPSFPQC
ncbi:hypothetical protein GCM10008090_04950 [Arenicella chitinivorans]|uniref:Uncharacterized protein n=1 Tax=Arenicella chitinivorans TaxID=1329800 RepID=A0A918RIQ6_9GAMM|nr:hypothetical protein [Arenicella chitinivorans]GGZ99376.1 hypothetical protein GCM10008090_04950 [Arenicella chitinivorans]